MLRTSLLLAAASSLAVAQLGGGSWSEYYPNYSQQTCEGASISGDMYQLPSSTDGDNSGPGCSNGHLRAENRWDNDYSSGVKQFQGLFNIPVGGGSNIAIKQTFNGGDEKPYFILATDGSGNLYSVEDHQSICSGCCSNNYQVQINTIHDADNNVYQVYVNGNEVYTDNNAPSSSFYDKNGAYATDSGYGPMTLQWDDVHFWTQN